jgi:hypothetical protein
MRDACPFEYEPMEGGISMSSFSPQDSPSVHLSLSRSQWPLYLHEVLLDFSPAISISNDYSKQRFSVPFPLLCKLSD